jgi:hypothetical protein
MVGEGSESNVSFPLPCRSYLIASCSENRKRNTIFAIIALATSSHNFCLRCFSYTNIKFQIRNHLKNNIISKLRKMHALLFSLTSALDACLIIIIHASSSTIWLVMNELLILLLVILDYC